MCLSCSQTSANSIPSLYATCCCARRESYQVFNVSLKLSFSFPQTISTVLFLYAHYTVCIMAGCSPWLQLPFRTAPLLPSDMSSLQAYYLKNLNGGSCGSFPTIVFTLNIVESTLHNIHSSFQTKSFRQVFSLAYYNIQWLYRPNPATVPRPV